MMKLTAIIPCYNEEPALEAFYKETLKVVAKMEGVDFGFVFVNDGSKDRTLEKVKALAEEDKRVRFVSFSRNFGKEAAIYAGLQYVEKMGLVGKNKYVVIMDADLQDPPRLLPEMLEAVAKEGYNSVATRRVTRKGEPAIRSLFARMFYKLMNRISQADIVDGARDYRMMDEKFVRALLEMKEYNRFSKGLFGWVGFKTKWLAFENVERVAGETKWSFWKLFKYSIEGIVAFSTAPLVIASVIGVICCIGALALIVFVVLRQLIFGDSVDGWTSMVTIMLFIGGVQLLCIGILGQYLSKTYLETKRRPVYIVDEESK